MFPKMGVPPNHPILLGFSNINPPFGAHPPFKESPIFHGASHVTLQRPRFSGLPTGTQQALLLEFTAPELLGGRSC